MTMDYMQLRSEQLSLEASGKPHAHTQKFDAYLERLESLRCLSRDFALRIAANPEMVDAPAGAIAARSVALAECLLAELGKAERGEFITEEENMMNGTLFGLFRQWHYEKQAKAEEAP